MKATLAVILGSVLLASFMFSFVQPSASADGLPPEITNISWHPKYPMENEVVTFNATVVDSDVITVVEMYICFLGTCDLVPMSDPDGDSVYGAEHTMHTGVDYADIWISATDDVLPIPNTNATDPEYFPIVHWINLTADATPSYPVIDDPFWVNGTAVYDDNNSAPAEQSLVRLEILETEENWTTYVDSNGDYSFALVAPSTHGSYNLNVTVTNRTMAANVLLPLDVADIDTDGDGTPNYLDEDDDNDGLTDVEEEALGTSPIDPDTDDDGYGDLVDDLPLDETEWLDTDEDGIGNNADPDDDNDDVSDEDEAAMGTDPLDPDSDDDGYNDKDDAFPLNNTEWSDNDEDGFGDNTDDDDDNDGLTDEEEIEKGTDPTLADTDGDGVDDKEDYDPLDATVWDSPAEPLDPMIWVVLAIVIIIVVVIVAATLSSRRAPPE